MSELLVRVRTTPPSLGSLAGDQLCGLYPDDGDIQGTYTTMGITKLCEVLVGSAVTSLRCAASNVCVSVSAH